MTIKRYHADVISEHAEGSIVLYADHLAELEAQAARIKELEAERDANRAEHNRLVRELDVIWNGEAGAAKQASLCDMVSQIGRERDAMLVKVRDDAIEECAAKADNLLNGLRAAVRYIPDVGAALRAMPTAPQPTTAGGEDSGRDAG